MDRFEKTVFVVDSESNQYYTDTLKSLVEDIYEAYDSSDKRIFSGEEKDGRFILNSHYNAQSHRDDKLYGEYESKEGREQALLEYKEHVYEYWSDNRPLHAFDTEEEAKEFIG